MISLKAQILYILQCFCNDNYRPENIVQFALETNNIHALELGLKHIKKTDNNTYNTYITDLLFNSVKRNVAPRFFFALVNSPHCNIRLSNDRNETLLHWAVSYPYKVDALIKAHSDINVRDRNGNTPLYNAAQINNNASIALLLSAGASADISNNSKQKPLHIAALKGSLEAVKLLLQNTRNIMELDSYDNTPLDYVILVPRENKKKLIKEFLKAGIDTHAYRVPDEQYLYNSLAHWTIKHNQIKLLYYILNNNYNNPLYKNRVSQTILHYVAEYIFDTQDISKNIIHYLINKGIDINDQDEIGDTCLHKAVKAGNGVILKELLFYPQIQLSLKNNNNLTIFNLLESPHRRQSQEQNMLSFIVYECLTKHRGNSLLHLIALEGNGEEAQRLLNQGRSAVQKNNYGFTPALIAKEYNHTTLYEALALAEFKWPLFLHKKDILSDVDILCTSDFFFHPKKKNSNLFI